MKLTLEAIESILISHDPEGLIKMGCLIDEYHHEAKIIFNSLDGLTRNPGFSYIQELVGYIFWNRFAHTGTFCAWMHHSDLITMLIALDICALMDP